MSDLSVSKTRTLDTYETVTTIANICLKMVSHYLDFLSGLPRSRQDYDTIWVIIDRLIKFPHFFLVKTMDSLDTLSRLYVKEITRLHEAPSSIISDKDPRFITHFWKKDLGLQHNLSTTIHSQTNGKSERVIQILRYASCSYY